MRPVPIRVSLTTALVLLVALAGAVTLIGTLRAGDAIASDLSQRYLDETEQSVRGQLENLFDPVLTTIRSARAWALHGVIRPHDVEASNAVFVPILRAYPQITSLATGDEQGYSYRIGSEPDGFLNRVVHRPGDEAPADFHALDPEGAIVRSWQEISDYDARSRPWYGTARAEWQRAGSAAAAEVVWTDPFVLRTSQNPGIAASLPFEGPDGDVYMTTFNVMLTKLSDFTSSLRPTPHGVAFVLTGTGEVIGFPALERYPTSESRVALVKELGNRMPRLDELGSSALARTQAHWEQARARAGRHWFAEEIDGEVWRLAFAPYDIGRSTRLWIAVAVPDADYLDDVKAQQRLILAVSLLTLVGATLLALGLARLYGRPLLELVRASERIEALDLEGGEPVHSHVLEVQRLAEAQERMRSALDSFSRYVPTPVVRELLRQGEAARIGGRVRQLTVMFSDIRGFTTVAEAMGPAALTEHLATYFEHLMRCIALEGGVVDKVVGDAIMSLWGAPVEKPDHAARAVRAALASAAWLSTFNERCAERGLPALRTGFGIATGQAFVGNIGAPVRLNYTALGDVVNLSSRLEGACKVYGTDVLCNEEAKRQAGEGIAWRRVDVVAVKGKTRSETIYEPLGLVGQVPPEREELARRYETAFASYLGRDFPATVSALRDLLASHPDDLSVRHLLESAEAFLRQPPPPDWDGVLHMDSK